MKYIPKKAPKGSFSLLDNDIKKHLLYEKRGGERDKEARTILEKNCDSVSSTTMIPGNMILFKYFEPKTKEDLEYYDAYPCTIFFGIFNSKQGKRVLGFNLHYYPAKYRQRILAKIFAIYKPVLTKYWEQGATKEIDGFDYEYLISNLKKSKMDFGVRMYDPSLCSGIKIIPPMYWSTAVFTEGWFKKETRAAIMKHWEQLLKKQK